MTATQILDSLDSAELQRRLAELEAERKAAMTLLRAAKHRDRGREERKQREGGEKQSD